MTAHMLDQQIRERIQAFLDEMAALVRAAALESVREALGGGAAPALRRGPGRPRGQRSEAAAAPAAGRPRSGGKRIRRSAEDLERLGGQVLAYVKSHPGQRLEEIGAGLETDTGILKRPIANLLGKRSLRTTGQKRGTRYFAGAGGRGAGEKTAGRAPARKKQKLNRKRASKRTAKAAAKSPQTAAA